MKKRYEKTHRANFNRRVFFFFTILKVKVRGILLKTDLIVIVCSSMSTLALLHYSSYLRTIEN